MTTKRTAPKGQAKPCPASPAQFPAHPPVTIPTAKFGLIFDQVMEGTRLILALHRMAQTSHEDRLSAPEELIAWQGFLALSSACDELGHHAGYSPDERDVE